MPSNYKIDQAFRKKYSVNYHDFGCLAPGNMDYYARYNLLVFDHLKNKFGKEWEKDIKENTLELYNWKNKK
jgi:hypothetical protein